MARKHAAQHFQASECTGEAFSDFLRAYGIEVPAEPKLPDGSTPMPTRRNRWRDLRVRLGVGNGLGLLPTITGSMATRDFAAIHMMWGAVNELTTLTGYHALIRRSSHPELHTLLRKVIRDERRHFAFYRAQAKAKDRSDPWDRSPHGALGPHPPVDAGRRGRQDGGRGRRPALYLFGDGPEGRDQIREIDQTIAGVPGLEGVHLLEDYLDCALRRAAERPGWTGVADTHVAPAHTNGHAPPPTHWAQVGAVRAD